MIKCIIIDDEPKSREVFNKIVERYFSNKLQVLAMVGSVKEGVLAINKHKPDIVFLDIEMPEENGFKLFDYFQNYDFVVVFVTAFNQHAVSAIKHSALDYLLKPINYIDLNDVLNRFEKHNIIKSRQDRIELLLESIGHGNSVKIKVAIPTASGFDMVCANQIIYCEADQNYTKINLSHNKQIVAAKTLKHIEDILPEDIFFRIHKSYLINLNYVEKYLRNEGHKVLIESGILLDVASRRVDSFVKAITEKR